MVRVIFNLLAAVSTLLFVMSASVMIYAKRGGPMHDTYVEVFHHAVPLWQCTIATAVLPAVWVVMGVWKS